jgi:hypothetical protein
MYDLTQKIEQFKSVLNEAAAPLNEAADPDFVKKAPLNTPSKPSRDDLELGYKWIKTFLNRDPNGALARKELGIDATSWKKLTGIVQDAVDSLGPPDINADLEKDKAFIKWIPEFLFEQLFLSSYIEKTSLWKKSSEVRDHVETVLGGAYLLGRRINSLVRLKLLSPEFQIEGGDMRDLTNRAWRKVGSTRFEDYDKIDSAVEKSLNELKKFGPKLKLLGDRLETLSKGRGSEEIDGTLELVERYRQYVEALQGLQQIFRDY